MKFRKKPVVIEAAKRMRELARRPGDLEYDSWASSLPQGGQD